MFADPHRTKSFKTVEASLRLDAIASAGFKISRSKMANLIRYPSFPSIPFAFSSLFF